LIGKKKEMLVTEQGKAPFSGLEYLRWSEKGPKHREGGSNQARQGANPFSTGTMRPAACRKVLGEIQVSNVVGVREDRGEKEGGEFSSGKFVFRAQKPSEKPNRRE